MVKGNYSLKANFDLTEYKIVASLLSLYLFLCPFEFALNNAAGSLLKYFGLMIAFFCLAWFYKTHRKLDIKKEYLLLILWVLIGFASLLWTPAFSDGEYYVVSSGNMVFIITIISFIEFDQKSSSKILLNVQISCFLFSLLMVLKGNLYHNEGIRYTLVLAGKEVDPNNIAGFLLPGLLISIYNTMLLRRHKFLNFVSFSVILVAILFSGSRGGVLSCAASLMVIIPPYLKKQKTLGRNILFIGIIIIFIYYLSKTFVNRSILERLNPFTYGIGGGSDRLYLWKYGLNMIEQNPIIGYGIGSYNSTTGSGMHNTYLLIWYETGIFSLMFFIGSMYILTKKLLRMKQYLGLSILAGALVCIFFLDAYQKKYLWTNILLCTILVNTVRSQTEGNSEKQT